MNFRKLEAKECRLIIMRHGTNGEYRDSRPKDTICDESYEQAFKFGFKLRAGGIKLDEVVMSPRGRAVKTAFACAEGNSKVGESLPSFRTDERMRDGSNDKPEIVAIVKAYAEKKGIGSEQACVECPDPEVRGYILKRAEEHAALWRVLARWNTGQTILACGHGGLIEPGILLLKNPETPSLPQAGQPIQYLEMGGAVELILTSAGELVEENYLR